MKDLWRILGVVAVILAGLVGLLVSVCGGALLWSLLSLKRE